MEKDVSHAIGLLDGDVRQNAPPLLGFALVQLVALQARGLSPTSPSRHVFRETWVAVPIPYLRVPSATLPAHVGVTCNQECADALAGFASADFCTKPTPVEVGYRSTLPA